MSHAQPEISFDDFLKVDMRVGTIMSAHRNEKAKKPAYVIEIDFGSLGTKTTSAQITEHYEPDQLVGKQVIAVMNFAPKRVAGVKSEVLVLASVHPERGTILLEPDKETENGSRIL